MIKTSHASRHWSDFYINKIDAQDIQYSADHTTESHLPPENIDHEGGGEGDRGLGGRNDIIQRKGGSSHLAWCICWQVCISKWETITNLISHSTSLKENCFIVPRIFSEMKYNNRCQVVFYLFLPIFSAKLKTNLLIKQRGFTHWQEKNSLYSKSRKRS